ncbi:hypothetical protein [Winogradskyella sp. PG-2]|uniref:hypothetical protein n=1 Tax=Winogradskyella sp. PG-2 TaxID=754409 RepID=UPI00045883C1|nr:hypothetical protein [Winogradskyella sp. PG-2]BAO74627.1 hypothetical protein WPG_0397 [Winogradskyella sp. PG-2]
MKTTYNKTIKLLILGFFISGISIAQERYRITYDYKTEKVNYLLLDKNSNVIDTLNNPKLKRNSLVELKLRNINPFAVQVRTDVKEEDLISSGQGFNFSSLLGGINSFTGDNIDLNTSNLPDSGLFKSEAGTRGSASATSNFKDLNNTITNVSALKTTLLSNLLNPNLDKESILKNIVETADAEQDVRLPSAKDNFYVYIAKVEKSIKESRSDLESNINIMSNAVELEIENDIDLSRGQLVSRNIALGDLQRLMTNLNQSTNQSLKSLEELRSLYTVLEASNFEQTYDYEITADKVNIELKFVQSDFSSNIENDASPTTLKTRNIKLFSKGGFKINTSVAMTLNNFGSKSNDYFIDESGVIGADQNDFFVPNLSTMINFYPFMGENFNIGGSFGLSIPISGNDNVNGVNFLFGPSLFFGSNSRLSLSGGLAYGPVQKLTNGLEAGDSTSFTSIDNFTKNVYDFGYYFGISFSLFDIN